jgi:hypothetical protein
VRRRKHSDEGSIKINRDEISRTESPRKPLTSQIRKVTSGMIATSIDYRIFGDGTAIAQSCDDSTPIFLPRNCVAFKGMRVSVAHLRIPDFAIVVNTILIPYSLHATSLFNAHWIRHLKYLVFEFSSELKSISDSMFASSRLRSRFFPPTVGFISCSPDTRCAPAARVHFGRQ